MPEFGPQSLANLATCDPELQRVCREVIKFVDFSVIEGARADARQKQLFKQGKSTLDGVNKRSRHQVTEAQPLSRAVDLLPYPAVLHGKNIWDDTERFLLFIGMVIGIGRVHGIELVSGIDWNRDGSTADTNFRDMPHFQLMEPKK